MTTRDISATNITAMMSAVVRPIIFARFDFASGVKRFHTEIGPRIAVHPIFGSETYLGVGSFGGMTSDVKETISLSHASLQLSLTGVDPALISDALTDDYHRRDVDLMIGLDDVNGVLVDDPVLLWSGFMDHAIINLGEQSAEMTLVCEDRSTNLRGRCDLRFTDEDMQAVHTGDRIAEYAYRMVDLQIKWGGDQVNSGGGGRLNFSVPQA